jgi:hypothetical protein
MKVLLSGASGLIGSALRAALLRDGHEVLSLVRERPDPARGRVGWDPHAGILGIEAIGRLDAVVHLAGAGIGESRWTEARKALIRDSRVRGTRLLAEIFALLPERPKAFLCASAVGYYGDRGGEALDETSPMGKGFLADVCRDWEVATRQASEAGIRVVNLRSGVVLSPRGGALRRMLPPFRWGLGAVMGSGRQWMSWISLTDEVAAIRHCLENESLQGPVNLVAPEPVTNEAFAQALARVLGRPLFLRIPTWGVRALFGEMGVETVCSGQRVKPSKLEGMGFRFQASTLEEAFRLEGVGRAVEGRG